MSTSPARALEAGGSASRIARLLRRFLPSSPRAQLLTTLTLAALPLVVLSGWQIWRQAQDREAELVVERLALAQVASDAVDSLIKSKVDVLRTLALAPAVREPALGRLADIIAAATEANPELEGIGVFDREGWNLVGTLSPPHTLNIADRPYFRRAVETGQPIVGDAVIGRLRGVPAVTLAVPVVSPPSESAVVVGIVSQTYLSQELGATVRDPRLRIVVVDGQGTVVVHPDPAVTQVLTSWRGRPDVDAALAGAPGIQRVSNPDGAALLAAYAPARQAGWGVLVQQPEAEGFASIRQDFLLSAGLLVLIVCLVAGFGWVSGGQVARLYREAQRRAEAEQGLNAVLQSTVQARDEALAELGHAMETRDEFLATAAHDLKNPLTAIKGFAGMLRRVQERSGGVDPDQMRLALATIEHEAAQMARLVDELLDVARLQMGEPLDLEARPTDLVALARQVAAEQQTATEQHTIAVVTREKELVGAWDPARLERVLHNLVGNAVKYSPAGGKVTVALARQPGDANSAVLEVRDEGLGIPDGELGQIFDRFRRGANVVGRIPGTGLGLTATRQLVEQLGGVVAVASQEGVGSTFTVRLPLDGDGRPSQDGKPISAGATGRNLAESLGGTEAPRSSP